MAGTQSGMVSWKYLRLIFYERAYCFRREQKKRTKNRHNFFQRQFRISPSIKTVQTKTPCLNSRGSQKWTKIAQILEQVFFNKTVLIPYLKMIKKQDCYPTILDGHVSKKLYHTPQRSQKCDHKNFFWLKRWGNDNNIDDNSSTSIKNRGWGDNDDDDNKRERDGATTITQQLRIY